MPTFYFRRLICNDKGCGEVILPAEVDKYIISYDMAGSLLIAFNEALDTGYLPACWKNAIISILFKKGCKCSCDNYRGLSLLSHESKILEKLIEIVIKPYLELYCIPESQCGFRSNRSTMDSIFCSRLLSQYCFEKGVTLFKCLIDLVKAYDKVNLAILRLILKAQGVPDKLIALIKALHDDAKARVKINGVLLNY